MNSSKKWVGLVLAVLVACNQPSSNDASGNQPEATLKAQVASYDVAVGNDQRVLVGLFTSDQRFVTFGEIEMEFFFLSEDKPEGEAGDGPTATGRFLPVPNEAGGVPEDQPGPMAAPASRGRGVYEAYVDFDQPGYYALQVTADIDGLGTKTAQTPIQVLEEHAHPAEGDKAPRTENLRPGEPDTPPQAVDSRAKPNGDVPDPELHRAVVANSIEQGRPVLLTISTPVYCVSRFCGPITDIVQDLARRYRGERIDFVHVEVWRDYEKQTINKSAAEWIYRNDEVLEPWVYLIDAKGKVAERWDNVATESDMNVAIKKILR